MEVRKLLKTYRIHMPCPKCGAGEMEFVNDDLDVAIVALVKGERPMYKNRCNVCGYKKEFPYMYPRMDYEETDS